MHVVLPQKKHVHQLFVFVRGTMNWPSDADRSVDVRRFDEVRARQESSDAVTTTTERLSADNHQPGMSPGGRFVLTSAPASVLSVSSPLLYGTCASPISRSADMFNGYQGKEVKVRVETMMMQEDNNSIHADGRNDAMNTARLISASKKLHRN